MKMKMEDKEIDGAQQKKKKGRMVRDNANEDK